MKCPKCGSVNPDIVTECFHCHSPLEVPAGTILITKRREKSPLLILFLAIGSVVFGISSSLLGIAGFFSSIAGIILGAIAISSINNKELRKEKGLAIAGVILSIIGLCLTTWIGFGKMPFRDTKKWARYVQCSSQLSDIGKAIALYSNDYQDQYPPTLEVLVQTQFTLPKNLICPARKDLGEDCSYVYRGSDLTATCPAALVIAYDKYQNHKDQRNVLFAGYNVERMTEAEFQKAIETDNRLRRQSGLPEKPLKKPEVSFDRD